MTCMSILKKPAAEGNKMPKTKIVCTLGPASRSVEMIEKLLRSGMNVARFNFSHGTHEYHQQTLDNLRAAMDNTRISCAVMLDTKVENQEGVANFDDILANSDAFMVARGDLGMEIPIEKIFLAQKVMIYKCNIQGKPVVTATQMLESMIKSPRPTRAEATDVANAVIDGTDCVMLSGETAAGGYPEQAVKTMASICLEAENTLDYSNVYKRIMDNALLSLSPVESLASSAVKLAHSCGAAAILVLTRGGTTARLVAKYRPGVPVLSVVVPEIRTDSLEWTCSSVAPAKHSLVVRGVIPLLFEGSDPENVDVAVEFAKNYALDKGICKPGESIVALHRMGLASAIKILTA